MAALVIANPNINIYFHKIGFISVGKLSLNVKCPCSLERKFLWIAPCSRRCSFLSFLQRADPPVPTRAACARDLQGWSLHPEVLPADYLFFLLSHHSLLLWKWCYHCEDSSVSWTKTVRKVLGNLMLLQIVNSAVATSMLQGKILFNGLLLS